MPALVELQGRGALLRRQGALDRHRLMLSTARGWRCTSASGMDSPALPSGLRTISSD